MDYFKKIQYEHKRIGVGGWTCTCCGIASNDYKTKAKNKKAVKRYARRVGKQEIGK